MKNEISLRLQQLRGINSFRAAAAKAGLPAGHWHTLEAGKNKPTARTIRRIAAAYGVDPDWIVEGKGRGPQNENFLVKESTEEYKATRLDRNLLKPFLPMTMLMWLVRELPRVDSKVGDYVLRVICERCAFEDQMVWEVRR